jgi:nucleoprotein TPR
MPLFLTEEELSRYANDAVAVAEKADAFICQLYKEVDTVRAEADAASITAEQTCSLLEQKYLSLSAEVSKLESQNTQLQSSLDHRLADLAQVQTEKHQLHLQSVRTRFLSYFIVILFFFFFFFFVCIYVDICVCGFRYNCLRVYGIS